MYQQSFCIQCSHILLSLWPVWSGAEGSHDVKLIPNLNGTHQAQGSFAKQWNIMINWSISSNYLVISIEHCISSAYLPKRIYLRNFLKWFEINYSSYRWSIVSVFFCFPTSKFILKKRIRHHDAFWTIYPSQRHNLPPFPKFSKFSPKNSKLFNFFPNVSKTWGI